MADVTITKAATDTTKGASQVGQVNGASSDVGGFDIPLIYAAARGAHNLDA